MCALLWVDGLQIVGSKSDLAAQVEVQVHVGIVVDESLHVVGKNSEVARR